MSLSNDHFSNDYWISGEDHNGWEDGGEVDQEKDPVITAMVTTTKTHLAEPGLRCTLQQNAENHWWR